MARRVRAAALMLLTPLIRVAAPAIPALLVRITLLASLVPLAGCNSASEPRYQPAPQETRISIAGLKSRCDGLLSTPISENLVIYGQVVANDLYGEFDREIVIQDQSGGIGIALDGERIHDRMPFGTLVEVRCNGLVLTDYGGKISLGYASDEFGNRTIPAQEADRFIRLSTDIDQLPATRRLKFNEVTHQHINTRVRFDNVRFGTEGRLWCDVDESGRAVSSEREIVDTDGNRFLVRTLHSCEYAMEYLPSGEGSLIGVIDYFGGKFSLRVTFHEVLFPESLFAESSSSPTIAEKRLSQR